MQRFHPTAESCNFVLSDGDTMLWEAASQPSSQLLAVKANATHPPISNYPVGALVQGASGAVYGGINAEFPELGYSASIHAEQFVVALAWHAHETQLTHLACTSPPCGHCRQFLLELQQPDLMVTMPDLKTSNWIQMRLDELLPKAFSLVSSGASLFKPTCSSVSFTKQTEKALASEPSSSLAQMALEALQRSHTPVTPTERCGIALTVKNSNTVYTGALLENSAYNPSLHPLSVALVGVLADGHSPSDIESAAFVGLDSARWHMATIIQQAIQKLAPNASVSTHTAILTGIMPSGINSMQLLQPTHTSCLSWWRIESNQRQQWIVVSRGGLRSI